VPESGSALSRQPTIGFCAWSAHMRLRRWDASQGGRDREEKHRQPCLIQFQTPGFQVRIKLLSKKRGNPE